MVAGVWCVAARFDRFNRDPCRGACFFSLWLVARRTRLRVDKRCAVDVSHQALETARMASSCASVSMVPGRAALT